MNLWVPLDAGKFLNSCTIGGFSRKAQLQEWVIEGRKNRVDWNLNIYVKYIPHVLTLLQDRIASQQLCRLCGMPPSGEAMFVLHCVVVHE
jgi:hypothetical protein